MTLELEVVADAATAATRVAEIVAEEALAGVRERGAFSLALSRARPELPAGLRTAPVPWETTRIYQVDERIAPKGDPERNLTAIVAALPAGAFIQPMPVEDADLDRAADRYAAALPTQLDFVHLGLGADGHTASLVSGDALLGVRDRLVAVTAEYAGSRRMTLTYQALNAARKVVWLVTGREKRDALTRLLAGDRSIPAAGVAAVRRLVVADREAVPSDVPEA